MAGSAKIELDKRFKKRVKGRYENWEFNVGVEDGPHKDPQRKLPNLKSYAGGPARKVTSTSSKSISQISESLRRNTGINIYTEPFKHPKSKDILDFSKEYLKLAGGGRSDTKRVENLCQAIIRNPILRGDYGSNSSKTAEIKGFNRFMIDTAQLFKAIKAAVKRVARV